jgi:hypothetical protein
MGRTEFLPQRLEVSPGWKAQTTHESEMALFSECMQECARKVLDTADIVRDGDFSPLETTPLAVGPRITSGLPTTRPLSNGRCLRFIDSPMATS